MVEARDAAETITRPLSDRFQQLIDSVAMQLGLQDQDAYLDLWARGDVRSGPGARRRSPEAIVAELEARFPEFISRAFAAREARRLAARRLRRATCMTSVVHDLRGGPPVLRTDGGCRQPPRLDLTGFQLGYAVALVAFRRWPIASVRAASFSARRGSAPSPRSRRPLGSLLHDGSSSTR